jgi:hypothetical protein
LQGRKLDGATTSSPDAAIHVTDPTRAASGATGKRRQRCPGARSRRPSRHSADAWGYLAAREAARRTGLAKPTAAAATLTLLESSAWSADAWPTGRAAAGTTLDCPSIAAAGSTTTRAAVLSNAAAGHIDDALD